MLGYHGSLVQELYTLIPHKPANDYDAVYCALDIRYAACFTIPWKHKNINIVDGQIILSCSNIQMFMRPCSIYEIELSKIQHMLRKIDMNMYHNTPYYEYEVSQIWITEAYSTCTVNILKEYVYPSVLQCLIEHDINIVFNETLEFHTDVYCKGVFNV